MKFCSCDICKNLYDNSDMELCLVCKTKYCKNCKTRMHNYCYNCNSKIISKNLTKK